MKKSVFYFSILTIQIYSLHEKGVSVPKYFKLMISAISLILIDKVIKSFSAQKIEYFLIFLVLLIFELFDTKKLKFLIFFSFRL